MDIVSAPTAQEEASRQGRRNGPETAPARAIHPASLRLARILVPLDFSDRSEAALAYAIPLAGQFGGRITLLHVLEALPYPIELPYLEMQDPVPVEPAKQRLAELARKTIPPELFEGVRVDVGLAFHFITEAARELTIDLIVLTTHGYSGLRHVLLGSTAERVVRYAPCPVLTVRSQGHDHAPAWARE